ncbi:MAG: PorV/PorQ family protein [Endomicrobia bacterium]|nr:PorV/PorQ family protein [Endomicrobiia bacterium]
MNKKIFAFLFLFVPSLCLAAFSDDGLGTSGAAFLKLGSGARAVAMGGAFTSLESDSSDSIYWNPAGLASNTRKDLTLMYASYFEGASYEWAAFSMPTDYGVFGAAIQYLSYGSIEGRDINGFATSGFSPYDLAVYLSYARSYRFDEYSSRLSYGANLKYIYSKIDNSASAFAVDAGAIYTLVDELTSFGFVLQNVGTSLKYNEEKEALPLMFKIGASRIFFDNLLASADIVFPSDNNVYLALGGEYKLCVADEADIFFRMGYSNREKDIPGFAGFNAGFGARYLDYFFDYAFSPYGDLGIGHRVSLGIKFGESRKESESVKPAKEQKKPEVKKRNKGRPVSDTYRKPPQKAEQTINKVRPPAERDKQYEPKKVNAERDKQYSPQKQKSKVNKNYSVAVLNFVSNSVPKSECDMYTTMLRRALAGSDNLKPVDKRFTDEAYDDNSINSMPTPAEAASVIKDTKADKLIMCSVKKSEGELNFNIYVYDKAAAATKKYNVVSSDSYADVQRKLKEFVDNLSRE